MSNSIRTQYFANLVVHVLSICIYLRGIDLINMTWHGDRSALRHLPALYNKRNHCIHVHVYLFVRVHVDLSIGFTIMHI